MAGVASADLRTIGTASYGSDEEGTEESYKLIYDYDSPFGPITWLDYTSSFNTWQDQVGWASGLGNQLTVTLNPGYTTSVDWSTGWRLPLTDESQANLEGGYGYEGPDVSGYHNYRDGFNMVNSEMGYLYYEALGNKGAFDTSNHYQPDCELYNKYDFNNLNDYFYWSGTEYSPDSDRAWEFGFGYGGQDASFKGYNLNALAVRPGEVFGPGIPSAVPEPTTMLLLGTGLIGLAGLKRKKFKK